MKNNMKKDLISFDEFINPKKDNEFYKNKNIDINDIYACSYVIYFILEYINGEIVENYYILGNDNKDELLEYYFSSYAIYAINELNKIVCKVI